MGFDTHIENRSPFDVQVHVQFDANGQEVTVLMLSASFIADAAGRVGLAEVPLPVSFADVPWGDPARSSIRYDADIAPAKALPEILVNGSAHAPGGRAAEQVTVGLAAGDIRKLLDVTGDRVRHLGGFSAPHPFTRLPIRWERAFGGAASDSDIDPRNPLGIGHGGAPSADPEVQSAAPNVTLAGHAMQSPSDRPDPAGFCAIGRGWLPRRRYAGTYDQAWLDTQWPLPPHDLDPRHHQAAPADQQSAAIGPGLRVALHNLTPEGVWEFTVPRLTAPVRLLRDREAIDAEFRIDTLLIEPDDRRFTLKSRLAFVTERTAPRLREVVIGHVSPVFLGARRKRKIYINPLGGDGTLAGQPAWEPA